MVPRIFRSSTREEYKLRHYLVAVLLIASSVRDANVPPSQLPTPTPAAAAPVTPAILATATPVERLDFLLPTPTPVLPATHKSPSCAEQSAYFVTQMTMLLRDWDAALDRTQHLAHIQLPDLLDNLQALHTRAEELPYPTCAVPIKALLVYGIDSAITSVQSFATHKPTGISWAEMLQEAQGDVDAARHATNAMLESAGSWQPMVLEDVQRMLPQYTWEAATFKSGATVLEAGTPPVAIQVFHAQGVVYKIYVGAVMFDLAAYPAAWRTIAPAVSALLPYWPRSDSWLARFGAVPQADGEFATSEFIGVTTLRAQHARNSSAGMELISVEIYFPCRPAPGE